MKIKKTTLMFFAVLVLIVVGGFFFVRAGNNGTDNGSVTGNVVNTGNVGGEVQKITLSTKNYNYYPNTIKVKVNQPVEITLDGSVSGCLRAFTIKDLGVYKVSRSPSETVDFTPTQKGTFRFSCSMGMGTGTIIVE